MKKILFVLFATTFISSCSNHHKLEENEYYIIAHDPEYKVLHTTLSCEKIKETKYQITTVQFKEKKDDYKGYFKCAYCSGN